MCVSLYVRGKERGLFLYALLHSYSLCVMPLSTFSLESDEEKEEDDKGKRQEGSYFAEKRSIFLFHFSLDHVAVFFQIRQFRTLENVTMKM